MSYIVIVKIMLRNGDTRTREFEMEHQDMVNSLDDYQVQAPTVLFKHIDGCNVVSTDTIQEISATPSVDLRNLVKTVDKM